MSHQPLVEDAFLRARWQEEYESFKTSPEAKALLERLRTTADKGLRDRIVALDAEIMALDAEITAAESEMNGLVYRLYKLSAEEIALVESVPG